MHIQWAVPVWVWPLLLPLSLLIVIWVRRVYLATEPAVNRSLRLCLTSLRCVALLLLLVAIAGPSLSRLLSEQRPPEVAIVLDDSASMAIADHAASTGTDGAGGADPVIALQSDSRWAMAGSLAASVDSVLGSGDREVTVTYLHGNGIDPLQVLPSPGEGDVAPERVGSDLSGLLRQVAGRFAAEPLRAVIFLGDGNETVAEPRNTRRHRGRRSYAQPNPFPGGGTYFVAGGLGDPAGPADRLIQDLRYPDVAYQGDEIVVELVVAGRFAASEQQQPITVRLHSGSRVVAEQTVEDHEELTRVELSFAPDAAGLQVYRLEVTPLVNERYLDNNQVTLAINVRKQRARVLLLANRPGWDCRFLAQAAASESRLELASVYPGPTGLVFADSLEPWISPRTAAEWQQFDGVVLTGWEGPLRDLAWGALERAVNDGLGLWVLPGPGLRGPDQPNRMPTELAELLPVQLDPQGWREADWFVRVGDQEHPILDGVAFSRRLGVQQSLTKLPPLRLAAPGSGRTGDQVLLETTLGRMEQASVAVPILVVGQRGAGRVAWFGGRPLWEVAFWELPTSLIGEGEQPARRLVRNLLVWTASGEEESGLGLRGMRSVYQEGERIRLEAQWRDMRGNPVTGRKVFLRVRSLDQTSDAESRVYSLNPVPGDPGAASLVLPPLQPGRYTVRPQSGDQTPVVGAEQPLVVAASSLEATQVRQDRRRLRQLADRLGGEYFNADSPAGRGQLLRYVAGLDLVNDTREIRQRWDFWAGWPFLTVVALLLGLEWFIRRRNGLL